MSKKPTSSTKPAGASAKPLPTGGGPLGIDGLARVTVPASATVAKLTGKAKLIAPASLIANNGAGIISDDGGGIISDNGGGLIAGAKGQIISDNGGGILSNNSGGIIANNGGGVIANNGGAYQLAQAKGPAAAAGFVLAEATLTFHDATGAVLVDANNQPLTATTDKTGTYTYSGPLPAGNLIAKIRLNPKIAKGELQAMIARDGAGSLTLDLDVASTIGAAYVLGQFVKGDQKVFNKLPKSANEKLHSELDVVRGYVVGAFAYDPKLLVEAADALRTREKTVDTTIDEVRALLLGQAALGAGRKATEVPLIDPTGLTLDAQGRLLIAEAFPGRLRAVAADGTIQTLIDGNFGKIKRSFPGLRDVAEGPDGSLYLLAQRVSQIFRIAPDGTIAPFVGSGQGERGPVGDPLTTGMKPLCFVSAPDGTLYISEEHAVRDALPLPPRVFKLPPGGQLEVLPGPPTWTEGNVTGIATGPGGTVYAYYGLDEIKGTGEIWRVAPGAPVQLASGLSPGSFGDLVVRPDGTLVITEQDGGRVVTLPATGGVPTPIAGAGGPAATRGLLGPASLTLAPDGTLYIADMATTIVHALRPDGRFEAVAGTQAAIQAGDVTTFAINGPGGLAFDAAGSILIAEAGSGTVKRFDGKSLTIAAGSTRGFGGDGGPATQAKFSALAGIAFVDGQLWLTDATNRRVRVVGRDGNVSSLSGTTDVRNTYEVGKAYDPFQVQIKAMTGVAIAPDGTPYIGSAGTHQIMRLTPGVAGKVLEVVAGRDQGDAATNQEGLLGGLFSGNETDPAKITLRYPFGMAFDPLATEPTLYVAEPGGLRIRKLTGLGAGQTPQIATHAGLSLSDALAIVATFDPNLPPPSRNGLKATEVGLFLPMGLCFDPQGNLYLAEAGTRSVSAIGPLFGGNFAFDASVLPQAPARVLKIDRATGTVSTICGPEGKWFTDPDAEDALVVPTAIGIAPDGRLVIVDTGANLVRILPKGSY